MSTSMACALSASLLAAAVFGDIPQDPDEELTDALHPVRKAIIEKDAAAVTDKLKPFLPDRMQVRTVFKVKSDGIWAAMRKRLDAEDHALGKAVIASCRLTGSYTRIVLREPSKGTMTDRRYRHFVRLIAADLPAYNVIFARSRRGARGYVLGIFIRLEEKWFYFPDIIDITREVCKDELAKIKNDMLKQEKAVAFIEEALPVEERQKRYAVNDMLDELGPATRYLLPALLKTLDHHEFHVRANAVQSLANCGPGAKAGVPKVARLLLEDRVVNIREYAARTLGALGPIAREAIPALEKAAAKKGPGRTPELAKEALAKIRGTGSSR